MIRITQPDVLKCIDAVETSCKELNNTANEMKEGLARLTGICSGNRFDQIKSEVDKKVDALNKQIAQLRSKAMPKLQEILAWVVKANRA